MHAEDLLIALAGLAGGIVNGIAGGGSLIVFPTLIAVGHVARVANVTTTVGIWAGYLGGIAGFRTELADQRDRVRRLAPVGMVGGLAGALLLLVTSDDLFRALAPVLILAACGLFALQPRLAARARARSEARATVPGAPTPAAGAIPPLALAGTFAAAVYGGYFGAGLGVILLAVLGLTVEDTLARINGVRGVLSLLINSIAVVVFAVTGDVAWGAAGILAATSLVGGYLGARLSLRLRPPVLRAVVITFGVVAAGKLLLG